jgi:hypothetical protein
MAKGARASTRKRNNAALRAKVFGPVHDARTERLSAKLQELISQPKPSVEDKAMKMDTEPFTVNRARMSRNGNDLKDTLNLVAGVFLLS